MFGLIEVALLLLVFLLAAFYILYWRDEHPNLPPGPKGLPLVGSLLDVLYAKHVGILFMDMAQLYGEVMSLRIGRRTVIVLSGYDIMKEAFIDKADVFSGRPVHTTSTTEKRDKGILGSSQWRERRRLCLASMRDFGLGKHSLDERMQDEAQMMLKELEKSDGGKVDLHSLLPVVTANIICSIIRGDRFSYDSEEILKIIALIQILIVRTDFHNLENYLPYASYLPYVQQKTYAQTQHRPFSEVKDIIHKWIDDHKKTFEADNIRDMIDLFIGESSKEDAKCQEENILPLIWDLFAAGTETTSTTLLWGLAYLIAHPDIQAKCRQEIHMVVGRGRIPEYNDSKHLNYINAVINEIQRMGNILPTSLQHATVEDTHLRGYSIPRGTIVIANMEAALKDDKYFPDPYTFRPERWLDIEGKLKRIPAQIPFSLGKRECLGISLAKKELFILFTAMVQNFAFDLETGTPKPDLNKGAGFVRTAPKYSAIIRKI